MKFFQFLILSFLSLIFILPSCASSTDDQVRVAILKDVQSSTLGVDGSYEIVGDFSSKGRRLYKASVEAKADGIVLDHVFYPTNHLMLIPRNVFIIWIKDRPKRYRGQLDIHLDPEKQTLLFVNKLNIEDYIVGVLAHEISDKWPMEAIMAQAIAVRTYTYLRKKDRVNNKFDVTNDIYSQVYGGKSAERSRTKSATWRTRGLVLTYNDEILPAYYHACCAGKTENVEELWNHKNVSPLKGNVCGFCNFAPHFNWKKNFQSSQIQKKLNDAGHDIWLIKDIRVKEKTPSDRNRIIQIEDRRGKVIEIPGPRFRLLVGPNDVKSNKYDVHMKGYYFDLVGNGWGHGIGLCQWGAYGMAKQGYDYREILDRYYPGARIEKY